VLPPIVEPDAVADEDEDEEEEELDEELRGSPLRRETSRSWKRLPPKSS